MRNLKKVLSLVLALVFVLGLATVGASAAYADEDSIEYTDAVATTSALGIFNGYEDGSFKPNGDITRQEVAKMIAVALNGGSFDPSLYANANIFNDVDGLWGEGYINYLAGLDILAGVGDGKFNPQGKITAQELAKILLVALGYPSELFVGSKWASSVNRVAVSIKLYQDYTGSYSKALTREEAALIIYNALTKDCVQAYWSETVDADDDSYYWEWKPVLDKEGNVVSFLNKYFKAKSNLGFVTATSGEFTELTGTNVVVSYSTVTGTASNILKTSTEYKDFRAGGFVNILDKVASFSGKLGTPVTVYTNSKTGAVIAVASRTIEKDPTVETIISYSTTARAATATAMKNALLGAGFYTALVDEYHDDAQALTGNGKVLEFRQFKASVPAGWTTIGTAVPVGGDEYFIAYKDTTDFAPYKLTAITATTYTFTPVSGTAVTVNKTASKNATGAEPTFYQYGTLEKDNWYLIKTNPIREAVKSVIAATYGSCTKVKNIEAVEKLVGGTTNSMSSNTVTINNTVYGLHYNAQVTAAQVYEAGMTRTADGYTGVDAYLDPYGYIFDAVASESAAPVVSDYVYIIGADVDVKGSGVFRTSSAKVQVLADDGTYGIYTLNFKYNATDALYYSGTYAFASVASAGDASAEAAAIAAQLEGNVFSYYLNDGVLTLVKKASVSAVNDAEGYKGAKPTQVAENSIILDAGTYYFNTATKFVYMNIDTEDYTRSKATTVGLNATLDIADNAVVFYVTDKTNTNVITKLIAVGNYTAASEQAYVFVDKLASKYMDSTGTYHYTWHYIAADGSEGTAASTTDYSSALNKIYVLKSDGTIGAANESKVVRDKQIASIYGTTIVVDGQDYYLPEDVVPISIDDAEFGVGSTVTFSKASNGSISGIWVVASPVSP